jgi:amino acid permease
MQYGFVIGLAYFSLESLKSVIDEIFDTNINTLYLGLFTFAVTAPLCMVRRIEKFAFTYIIADFLIFVTAITIIVFAVIHIQEKKVWG